MAACRAPWGSHLFFAAGCEYARCTRGTHLCVCGGRWCRIWGRKTLSMDSFTAASRHRRGWLYANYVSVCVCVSWWWLEGDRGKGARPKIESNARCDTRISSSSSTVPEDGFEKFTSGFYWVSFNGMAVDFVKCYVLNNLYMWACVCVCVCSYLRFEIQTLPRHTDFCSHSQCSS